MSTLRHIILVEDDPDIAMVVRLALVEMNGLEVRHYVSGTALLADPDMVVPDLFLLDYGLPGMTGDELLARLRESPRTAAVPAVFMTASLMPDRMRDLKQAGALDVIAKPFDPMRLAANLRDLFERANPRPR
ncbi:response regulator [Sphingomonas astaxanthinifaciens]|uniref:Response regulator n=1 Tax=Sphingomonas astaxanthinifaciens DSM 22298 TaxID=1123267 RepID=A0ABQ5Z7C7_9SPHN|nr:response regulator [Sphingomonas astaxanthinifaciens]GLR48688.1 response regulator [Sphingomonas astaxanthinifaciens DSM 22298]